MDILGIDLNDPEKMYKVRLIYVDRPGGSVFRTPEIEGWTDNLPEVGEQFCMVGEPLDPKEDLRWAQTSPVLGITTVGSDITIKTESGSTYRVEVLGKGSAVSG